MKADIGMDCVNDAAFGFASTVGCSTADFSAVEYRWIFWLSMATTAAFIPFAVLRVLYLSRCPSIARIPAILLPIKLIAGTALAALRLSLLIVSTRSTSHQTIRLVASTALNLAAFCLLLVLSPLEHFKCRRPSTIACLFLFATLVFDLARCAYLWAAFRYYDIESDFAAFPALFTAGIVVEFIFLILESARRGRWVAWDVAGHSPEETSSILSLSLYSWLNPLLLRGYRESLTMDHLYALDREISAETLDVRHMSHSPESSTWHLFLWVARPLGRAALVPVFPRLCLLGFTFCQPFFTQRLLTFLSSDPEDSPSSTASGLVAVAVLTYSGIAFSTALYWYYQERFQSLLRAFLISAIYRKTSRIQHAGNNGSAAVTLMGADVERIYTGLRLMHDVWANVIQIAVTAWLLQRQLGLAFLAPLVLVLLGFAASFTLSQHAAQYQSAWMASVQARIAITSAVLANIKDLRISGMTRPATASVKRGREDEIRVGERSRVLIAISASLSQMPQAVAPALAFAFGPHVLDETRAYTALSLLALLTAPLLVLLQSFPIIAACVACLRRIEIFLDQEERPNRPEIHVSHNAEKIDGSKEEAFVVVHDGSFGWTAENAVLKEVNLSLPKSSITFVVGPVASGKSTFCRALLRELPHIQGGLFLRADKLGYCDQSPFLFNASIRENIIGFSSFDTDRYSEVIQATMLVEDLLSLASGDRTMVGTKGVSLSGGQRQRISLARALYHDAEMLVLDDVFSGLDGSTQHQVCQAVFGAGGLLRRRGATAVICTHSRHLLSVADHVVVLSSDSTIAKQGSFADIAQDERGGPDLGIKLRNLGVELQSKAATTEPFIDATLTRPRSTPESSQTVGIGVYRHWLSTIGVLPPLLYLVLIVGVGFCSNLTTIWLKLWSSDSVSSAPKHSFAFWIGIYALLGAGVVLCVFPGGLIMLRTAVRLAGTDLHHAAVDTVMQSSLRFLSNTAAGKVLNLFSQDLNIIDTQLPRMVNNMCICLAIAIGQAVVIALSSAWLAISYPFFVVLLWAVQRIYLPTSKRLRILDLEAKTPLYTNFLDTLAGLSTIRAFGWSPHLITRNNALLDDSQRPSYLLAMAQQWLMLTMNVTMAILATILVVLTTQLGSGAGNVGAGLVTLITLGSMLTSIVIAYTGLETSLGAISRLKRFGEVTELEGGKNESVVVPDAAWPLRGRLQMKNVNASYNGTEKVLKGFSLVVDAGEKIAICGRTGSGKSSVLALLLRLIEPLPTSPESSPCPILIDNVPLNTVDRNTLRERVISTSQDAVFLPDGASFRTNLDPWAAASDAECNTVLHDIGLVTVVEAKGGLDGPVSGAELSTGQKQLFSLARAVLRRRVKERELNIDGGLLLLDEITSSADPETERRVRKVLEDEFAAYTVIMVTHREEMTSSCDRIITLDAGIAVDDRRLGKHQLATIGL